MCAGTPNRADLSCCSRKGATVGSASPTGTMTADSFAIRRLYGQRNHGGLQIGKGFTLSKSSEQPSAFIVSSWSLSLFAPPETL
jgi:hypothetical protein